MKEKLVVDLGRTTVSMGEPEEEDAKPALLRCRWLTRQQYIQGYRPLRVRHPQFGVMTVMADMVTPVQDGREPGPKPIIDPWA